MTRGEGSGGRLRVGPGREVGASRGDGWWAAEPSCTRKCPQKCLFNRVSAAMPGAVALQSRRVRFH